MAAVTSPNYGLMFDRPAVNIPGRALKDGKNFRAKNGTLESINLGWERFSENWTLDGPVYLIDNFFPRGLSEKLIFGTIRDLYLYDDLADTVSYLTPQYITGTVAVSGTAVTGTGTTWSTNARPGDMISFGNTGETQINPHGNDLFTKVLLHFAGADASTAFPDIGAGGAAHTWTAAGNAQVDTADKKFGVGSLLLDGTGDEITTPDNTDFNLAASNFTVDFWFKMGGGDGVGMNVAGQTDVGITAAGSSFRITRDAGGTFTAYVSNGTSLVTAATATTYTTASNPGWHHLELTRSANVLYLFIDGILAASTAFTGTVPNAAGVFGIGSRGSAGTANFFGWLDEFRLSVGIARHTANFTIEPAAYTSPWYEIALVPGNTSLTLTASAGLLAAGISYTIRRRFANAAYVNWSVDTFVNDGTSGNDLWFATNGLDYVVTWDGISAAATLHPEMGFICKTLSTFSNMMIYGNLTYGGETLPASIINSDVGLPLNAGDTGTGLSEQFVTHSDTDEILNLVQLGDYLIVYNERTLVPIQFVGDPLIFVFRVAISGVGPISANAIADFGDFHEFIGADSGYLFDGVTLKVTNTHVWRDVLRQTDPMRRRQAFGHFDEEQGDLIWSIPGNTDPGVGEVGQPAVIAWPEHYLEDPGPDLDGSPFSKRDFPFTTTGFYERQTGMLFSEVLETFEEFNFAWNDQFFQAAFPLNLAGDENGVIWVVGQTQTANGQPLPSFVRTGRMVLRSGRERDLLTRIYPYAHSLPFNLEVTLYMGDFVGGEPGAKGTELFNMNLIEGRHFTVHYRRGRVMEFQFGSSAGDPWILDGWDYDTKPGGMR